MLNLADKFFYLKSKSTHSYIQPNKSARTNELCWFKLTLQIISEIHFECHNFIKTGNSECNPILRSLWHPNWIGLDFGELNNNEIRMFHENSFEIIKNGFTTFTLSSWKIKQLINVNLQTHGTDYCYICTIQNEGWITFAYLKSSMLSLKPLPKFHRIV